jgi:hypothetical protein
MKTLTLFISACLLTISVFPQSSYSNKSTHSSSCKKVTVKKKTDLSAQYKKNDIKKSKRDMDKQTAKFQDEKYQDITKGGKGNKIAEK